MVILIALKRFHFSTSVVLTWVSIIYIVLSNIILQSYGATVERVPSSELMQTVDRYVRELGLHFLHPFDDLDIIAGYGR